MRNTVKTSKSSQHINKSHYFLKQQSTRLHNKPKIQISKSSKGFYHKTMKRVKVSPHVRPRVNRKQIQ